ncbi:hypothetical protein [Streptomyces sp. NPDC001750]|uniref:hypothetical protein n=1 Tax=Streptomyces sp. NPDC001750 TaxID=3364607 RepID=UPI0036A4F94D
MTIMATSPHPGLIGDMTEDDNQRGYERDETDAFRRLVQHLAADGDDRARTAGRRTRRTYAEMVPGAYDRQPILRMTTATIVYCGGSGER